MRHGGARARSAPLAPRRHLPTESTRLLSEGNVSPTATTGSTSPPTGSPGPPPVLISIGAGVDADRYGEFEPLVDLLGAVVVTRKVTDKGWMPRTRQVGITGLHVHPPLAIVIGAAGKFNHMIGLRSVGTVVGVNIDGGSPLFEVSDLGIVGDWAEVLPALTERLAKELTN